MKAAIPASKIRIPPPHKEASRSGWYLTSGDELPLVDCDWDPQGKYHSAATPHGVRDLVNFSKALDRMGQSYRWVEREEIQEFTGSRHYIRALHHPGTVLLQPAQYLKKHGTKIAAKC